MRKVRVSSAHGVHARFAQARYGSAQGVRTESVLEADGKIVVKKRIHFYNIIKTVIS